MKFVINIAFLALSIALISANVLAAQKKIPVTETSIKQKVAIVSNLLNKSAISKSIEKGANDSAKSSLAQARELWEKANADQKAGDFEAAAEKLNKAITLITRTARKVVTKKDRQKRKKISYLTRRESVEAILVAYDRVATEKGVAAEKRMLRENVGNYLDQAGEFAGNNQYDKATEVMEKAYFLATKITRDLRQGDTLIRELSFDNPKEEYEYELDRNDSHIMFLKLALKEKKPHPSFLTKIESLRIKSVEYREQAESKASSGDHSSAIVILSEGTKQLIKAIRMAGIFIPG